MPQEITMNLPIEGYLRHMDSREAADAGLLLWRENFIYFILFFAIPFWLCAFFLRLLPGKMLYFSYLILWWLKPLFDRLILHVISIRFFDSGADLSRLRRGLGKNILLGLPGDLLWRRFNPLRSVMIPVRMLETTVKPGKISRILTERKKTLKTGGIDYCFFLSIWGISVEITLLIGEILFFTVMTATFTGNSSFPFQLMENSPSKTEIYIFTAWCVNFMLVETIYVCMGFSLYINSRVEVEGWDLEINFRNFGEKYGKQTKKGILLLIFCILPVIFPAKTFTDDFQPSAADNNVPFEELQNILESTDFGSEKDSWGIRFKKPYEIKENTGIDFSPVFDKLQLIFAYILRIFLVLSVIAMAVILFIFARKMIYKKIPVKKKSTITALHGIDVKNPETLLQKSLDYYNHGELRLAWGYCIAALILSWQIYRSVIFPPNATEIDCTDMVNLTQPNSDEAKTFGNLLKHWINLAYAGRLPPPESFYNAVNYCKRIIGA
jgi:hypothetical protein